MNVLRPCELYGVAAAGDVTDVIFMPPWRSDIYKQFHYPVLPLPPMTPPPIGGYPAPTLPPATAI